MSLNPFVLWAVNYCVSCVIKGFWNYGEKMTDTDGKFCKFFQSLKVKVLVLESGAKTKFLLCLLMTFKPINSPKPSI